jgi:Putative zinc-finger
MNCQEVQLQLSGYLEKSLDAVRMKGIESHLASCPFCRAEAHGLSDCIDLVADLPSLEPPAGFARRVVAHAREIELEPRPWQRLLAVLRSTAPIQATAVLLVGVLAVLMYQKEPRLRDSVITESTPAQAMRAEPDANAVAGAAQSAPESAGDLRASRETRGRSETAARPAAPARAQSKSAAPAAEPKAASPSLADSQPERPAETAAAAPRRRPIQTQEVSTARQSPRPSADVFGIGAGMEALSRQPFGGAPFDARRALSPLSEPSPDFEFIVRRRGLERRDAGENASGESLRKRSEADAAIASAAAQRAVPAPAAPSSSIVEIRWFTVAAHHLEQFRQELAAEASIDSEKGLAAAERELAAKSARDPLLIKVIILPSER